MVRSYERGPEKESQSNRELKIGNVDSRVSRLHFKSHTLSRRPEYMDTQVGTRPVSSAPFLSPLFPLPSTLRHAQWQFLTQIAGFFTPWEFVADSRAKKRKALFDPKMSKRPLLLHRSVVNENKPLKRMTKKKLY